MKILLVHYRYYESSGPEKYLFNVTKLFEENGHEVVPFSLNYDENKKTTFSKYFPEPIVSQFHIAKNKNEISLKNKIRIIKNSFFNKDVYSKITNLIEIEKPDIAYVLQFGTKISTSIFDAFSRNNIPVALRLSDFNLICAKNTFYRDGEVCTKCIKHKYHSVINKCVHDNYLQSSIYYGIQKFNEIRNFQSNIDAIITPSRFTLDLLSKTNQYCKNKFFHIPTFINKQGPPVIKSFTNNNSVNELKLCYVGRIADDKGISFLIDAMIILSNKGCNVTLDIFGDDQNSYAENLKLKINLNNLTNIHFKGFFPNKTASLLYQNYHYSVIPSQWFDNMPNSLIESCISGVPVIASKIGSLAELIKDDFNGFTFEPSNVESLSDVLESLISINENKYNELSENSFKWISKYCDADTHFKKLIELFNKLINEKNSK